MCSFLYGVFPIARGKIILKCGNSGNKWCFTVAEVPRVGVRLYNVTAWMKTTNTTTAILLLQACAENETVLSCACSPLQIKIWHIDHILTSITLTLTSSHLLQRPECMERLSDHWGAEILRICFFSGALIPKLTPQPFVLYVISLSTSS